MTDGAKAATATNTTPSITHRLSIHPSSIPSVRSFPNLLPPSTCLSAMQPRKLDRGMIDGLASDFDRLLWARLPMLRPAVGLMTEVS